MELTDLQRKHVLLALSGLGNTKPSEHLRYLKSLHQTDPVNPLFLALFMQQLPASILACARP